ncbi:MAG: ATP-grasp domain-containing protein [Candidatus Sulfotelmatobacter sp.]
MKPIILVAATSQWFPTARLATAMANAGSIVEAICPPQHPLHKTHGVQRIHTYRGLAPLMSLQAAIEAANPDLIIPGDDLCTRHLHHLYRRELDRGEKGAKICGLIERSFGSPESFPIVYERATFMRIAEEEGIRVPKTVRIANRDQVRPSIAQIGLPAVLKADGTSGGTGVRIVHTVEEAERAFRRLQAPPLMARAVKRALFDRDKTLIWPSMLRRRYKVCAQSLVEGHEATSTVACWKGEVLAGLHFEVINKKSSAGPATVVHLIEHPEMTAAVEKMVRRLNLSGVHGFDFMLEASTGNAYLIEINPRITQVGHLTLGVGRDLPASLLAAMSGASVQAAVKVTDNDVITLFPQEWMRDPSSVFIHSGYHDVPWDEPDLVQACVQHARKRGISKTAQDWELSISALWVTRASKTYQSATAQPLETLFVAQPEVRGAIESRSKAPSR